MKVTTKRQKRHLIKQLLWTSSLVFVITGCNASNKPDSVVTAQTFVGLEERQNRTELRELVGVDPVRTEWCAAFVNAVLEIENIPNLHDIESTAPLMARSFLKWGERVDPADIQRGDLVVFPRGNSGWQGHVGFFIKEEHGHWIILGGNQSNEVRYDHFRPSLALGIRRAKYTNITRGNNVGNDRKDGDR